MSVARRCDHCQELVDAQYLKWSLSLPAKGRDKPAKFFDLCSDECLRDFAIAGIDRRALRREERDEREREVADAQLTASPSPLDIPPVSPVRAQV